MIGTRKQYDKLHYTKREQFGGIFNLHIVGLAAVTTSLG